jgi:hypothetical protein
MGLAVMLEIPLVIVNIQRGGPSTGLPTKTEQSDLLQAYYGRNGECPIPVIASSTPSDCFDVAYEAVRISVQHMTPVILLSDGYIANGAEPWKYPTAEDLDPIKVNFASTTDDQLKDNAGKFLPYLRDEKLVRAWAIPGTPGLEHRVGGLEKQDKTGNISYDSANHQFMVKTRAAKVEKIADYISVVKAFRLSESDNIAWRIREYMNVCDMFMFDTEGVGYGGTGKKFDLTKLAGVEVGKPYFLSGGIEPSDVQRLKDFSTLPEAKALFAVDINTKFELMPGVKDFNTIKQFISAIS